MLLYHGKHPVVQIGKQSLNYFNTILQNILNVYLIKNASQSNTVKNLIRYLRSVALYQFCNTVFDKTLSVCGLVPLQQRLLFIPTMININDLYGLRSPQAISKLYGQTYQISLIMVNIHVIANLVQKHTIPSHVKQQC